MLIGYLLDSMGIREEGEREKRGRTVYSDVTSPCFLPPHAYILPVIKMLVVRMGWSAQDIID